MCIGIPYDVTYEKKEVIRDVAEMLSTLLEMCGALRVIKVCDWRFVSMKYFFYKSYFVSRRILSSLELINLKWTLYYRMNLHR